MPFGWIGGLIVKLYVNFFLLCSPCVQIKTSMSTRFLTRKGNSPSLDGCLHYSLTNGYKYLTESMPFVCFDVLFGKSVQRDFQEKVLGGVKVLMSYAHKVLAQQTRPALRILPATTDKLMMRWKRKLEELNPWISRYLLSVFCLWSFLYLGRAG